MPKLVPVEHDPFAEVTLASVLAKFGVPRSAGTLRVIGSIPTEQQNVLVPAIIALAKAGLEPVVVQGSRTNAEQDALFYSGRGVTKVKGGASYHNYGAAIDVVPASLIEKENWEPESPLWKQQGEVLAGVPGIKWGGGSEFAKKGMYDPSHVQIAAPLASFKSGTWKSGPVPQMPLTAQSPTPATAKAATVAPIPATASKGLRPFPATASPALQAKRTLGSGAPIPAVRSPIASIPMAREAALAVTPGVPANVLPKAPTPVMQSLTLAASRTKSGDLLHIGASPKISPLLNGIILQPDGSFRTIVGKDAPMYGPMLASQWPIAGTVQLPRDVRPASVGPAPKGDPLLDGNFQAPWTASKMASPKAAATTDNWWGTALKPNPLTPAAASKKAPSGGTTILTDFLTGLETMQTELRKRGGDFDKIRDVNKPGTLTHLLATLFAPKAPGAVQSSGGGVVVGNATYASPGGGVGESSNVRSYGSDPGQSTAGLGWGDRTYDPDSNSWGRNR